jgi:uncharacterized LabA/DUF88 family protein
MRTTIYVDGFNLYNRRLRNRPDLKWLNLKALADLILDKQMKVQQVNFYTARISGRYDPGAPRRQEIYFSALETIPEIKIHEGNFAYRDHWVALSKPPKSKPEGYIWPQPLPDLVCVAKAEEKGSDVNLGCHLVRDAFTNTFDVAIVVTNDTDLVEPIRIAIKEANKIVGLLSPIAPYQSNNGKWVGPHYSLIEIASFTLHIHNKHLKEAQFPNVIPETEIVRPQTWSEEGLVTLKREMQRRKSMRWEPKE